MRGFVTIAVIGLAVGAWTGGALAQSSKISATSAKSNAAVGRAAVNDTQQVASKARAAALRHDADPATDLASLRATEPLSASKFKVTSKVSAKTGTALAAAQAGAGENAKAAGTASKFTSGGAAHAVSRAERQPDAVNTVIKP